MDSIYSFMCDFNYKLIKFSIAQNFSCNKNLEKKTFGWNE